MTDTYKLLTRLLVGVFKHQAKRCLGDDVIAELLESGSDHLGEQLLDILRGELKLHFHDGFSMLGKANGGPGHIGFQIAVPDRGRRSQL
jgi:hypothetical protein